MALEQTRFSRPLSRLELALAVIFIGLFIGLFVQRVMLLTVAAEAASLEQMIRNLRTGTMLFVARQLIEGRYDRIEELALSNPLAVVETPFGNYGGAITTDAIEAAAAGQWFYDTVSNELVYKVINLDYFRNAAGTDRVRLETVLNYDDRNNDGKYEHGIDHPRGVSLRVVDEYEWTY